MEILLEFIGTASVKLVSSLTYIIPTPISFYASQLTLLFVRISLNQDIFFLPIDPEYPEYTALNFGILCSRLPTKHPVSHYICLKFEDVFSGNVIILTNAWGGQTADSEPHSATL